MPGLTDITAPYVSGVEGLLQNHDLEINEDVVLEELGNGADGNPVALESALRQSFYGILASCDIDDPGFAAMWRLLDIVNVASDAELCETPLPFLLVEELLDSQTIHGCRKVFDYLESRRERMTARHWKAKHLVILRSCNELLRRLSRAEDTVFCGRVFIFLFQSFPLGDKSSVNLRGEYHTDNVTQYDQAAAEGAEDSMEVDEKKEVNDSIDNKAPPTIRVEGKESIDADVLYPTFWALQEYFAQPTKLFEAANLESFKKGLQTTLQKFKEVYRDEPRSMARATDEGQGVKRKLDNLDGDNFNPRYLTSRDLFELEIHDPAFRRHILVQSLIAVDFLLSQTAKSKSRLENLKNKSVIYDFILDEKDAQWAANMRGEIASFLQAGTEGKFYYRMVDTVLARDKNWLRWKAESCPPFQLDPVGPQNYSEARTEVQKAAAPRQLRKAPMGALDVKFLENHGPDYDPLDKFKDSSRWKKPEMDNFRGAIMDAKFDLDTADTEEEKMAASETQSSNTWQALRTGGRFSILDKLDDGNNLDPLFGIEPEQTEEDEEGSEGIEGKEEAEQTVVQIDGAGDLKGEGEDEDEGEGKEEPAQRTDMEMTEQEQEGQADTIDDGREADHADGQTNRQQEEDDEGEEEDEDEEEMGAEQVMLVAEGGGVDGEEEEEEMKSGAAEDE